MKRLLLIHWYHLLRRIWINRAKRSGISMERRKRAFLQAFDYSQRLDDLNTVKVME